MVHRGPTMRGPFWGHKTLLALIPPPPPRRRPHLNQTTVVQVRKGSGKAYDQIGAHMYTDLRVASATRRMPHMPYPDPPPPRMTSRRVVVSLRGPSHVASGHCVLSAAAAGAPALVSFPRSRSPVVGVPGLC